MRQRNDLKLLQKTEAFPLFNKFFLYRRKREMIMEDLQFLLDTVKTFFEEDDWHYFFHEEENCFTGGISLGDDCKINSLRFFVGVRSDHITCYHICNINAQQSNSSAVGEFLHRANYGLTSGNFEMDYNDGEIRYKNSVSLNDVQNDAFNTMRSLMLLGANMFQTYGDGLLAVAFGFKTPEEAVQDCESSDDE